jgi:hypothetical protein
MVKIPCKFQEEDSTSITSANIYKSGGGNGTIPIYKKNGIVSFSINGLANLTAHSSTVIGTIPEGFRPKNKYNDMYTVALGSTSTSGVETFGISISTNGSFSVYAYNGVSVQSNIQKVVTYLSA